MNNKILLLIDSLGTGGAQRQMINLAIGLKNSGFFPVICIYSEDNYFHEVLVKYNIDLVQIKRKGKFDFLFFFRMIYFVKKNNFVWTIAFLFNPSGLSLLIKIFLPNLRIIVSERSFEGKVRLIEKIFPRMLYFFADYITANSISQTKVLESKMPFLEKKIKYIPNGVLNQEWKYQYEDSKIYNLVSIGRVSDLKETKLLIKAVSIIRKNYNVSNFKVLWIGAKFDSNQYDNKYYEECLSLIDELNLSDIWVWCGQIKNVNEVLSKASLLVHMSKGEGFPNAICEAMSLGVPVIASNIMDHPFLVNNGVNGYLVDSGNLDGLAKAIDSFLSLSESDRKEMSENAFKTATQSFSFNKMVEHYCDLLNSKS